MKSKLTFFLLLLSLCLTSCNKYTEIKGDIYFVTKGGENYKFSAVKISAIPEKDIKSFIQSKDTDEQSAVVSYRSVKLECDKLTETYKNSPSDELSIKIDDCSDKVDDALYGVSDVYFQNLPQTEIKTTTDANGKFTLSIPQNGRYALAAQAERISDDKIEKYYWLVWIDSDGQSKSIVLSNLNLLGAGSPDSVIPALQL